MAISKISSRLCWEISRHLPTIINITILLTVSKIKTRNRKWQWTPKLYRTIQKNNLTGQGSWMETSWRPVLVLIIRILFKSSSFHLSPQHHVLFIVVGSPCGASRGPSCGRSTFRETLGSKLCWIGWSWLFLLKFVCQSLLNSHHIDNLSAYARGNHLFIVREIFLLWR